ncbi:glycosyltransferase [Vibrio pomeroyi]|uniref:glycosyltransferase n=1 Tax=Vibrio pomeroyi TaxID=198832 RepID=UPI0021C33677|nr:glycosyltransferase [Vibrio pomeroyi]
MVFVGRISEQKGLDILLKAIMNVRNDNINLNVIGDGPLLQSLCDFSMSIKNATIKFHGKIDNPYYMIKRSDLLVMPSRWEGLPTVLIESLALNTPVISTDCKYGPREIINNEKYLFNVDDVDELAKMLEEPNFGVSNGFDSKEYILSNIVDKYLKV